MKQPPPATQQRAATKRFDQLSELSTATLSILEQQGFTTCTPVQDAVIPLFCGNKVGGVEGHIYHPLLCRQCIESPTSRDGTVPGDTCVGSYTHNAHRHLCWLLHITMRTDMRNTHDEKHTMRKRTCLKRTCPPMSNKYTGCCSRCSNRLG